MEKTVVFCLVASLVLLSCAPVEDRDIGRHHYVGKEGITIKFMQDSPPPKMFDDMSFQVALVVQNKGASHIIPEDRQELADRLGGHTLPAKIYLNYDPFYMRRETPDGKLITEPLEVNLPQRLGKSDFSPTGETGPVFLGNLKSNRLRGQLTSPETKIDATICYPYQTILSTNICMDASKVQFNTRDQACTAADLSFNQGQGAPVAVNYVEVNMAPAGFGFLKPNFIIHLENVGGGLVLRPMKLNPLTQEEADMMEGGTRESTNEELCSLQFQKLDDMNSLHIDASIGNGIPLRCTPNPVKLLRNYNKIICTVDMDVLQENEEFFSKGDSFETTLNIVLSYAYTSTLSQVIEITRAYPLDQTTLGFEEEGCNPWEEGSDCRDKCVGEGTGYSCSCTTNDCSLYYQENPNQCLFRTEDLCPPGLFCCQRTVCGDIERKDDCIRSRLGCHYCESNNRCMQSCDTCADSQKKGRVCEEVQNEES